MKIKREKGMLIRLTDERLKSVEFNLLFVILEKLEEIRCGLIDIENQAPRNWNGE